MNYNDGSRVVEYHRPSWYTYEHDDICNRQTGMICKAGGRDDTLNSALAISYDLGSCIFAWYLLIFVLSSW